MRVSRSMQLLGLAAILLSTEFVDANRVGTVAKPLSQAPHQRTREVILGAQESRAAVDGEQTPELIPDGLAYRHFLSATSVHPNASLNDRQVQRLLLDRVGLSEQDRRNYLLTVEWLRQRLAGTDPGLAQQQFVNEAKDRLSNQLTPEGFQRLEAHVTVHVKQRIKIYSDAR